MMITQRGNSQMDSTVSAATPAAQIRGDMGIVVPTAEADGSSAANTVNFDIERALDWGWTEDKFRTKDGNVVRCIVAPLEGTRMVILKKVAEKSEVNGKDVFNTVLYVIFLDADDSPLHDDFLRLKLTASSTSATFWTLYDKPDNANSFFKAMQNHHKEKYGRPAYAPDMATYVFEPVMEVVPVGKGNNKSLGTRFIDYITPLTQVPNPEPIIDEYEKVKELVAKKREKREKTEQSNNSGLDMQRVEKAFLVLGERLCDILGEDKVEAVESALRDVIGVLQGDEVKDNNTADDDDNIEF